MIVLFAGTCASALLVGSIGAQASSINFENFNYSGSVTRYGSAADALADTNPSGPYVIGTATNGSLSTLPNARDAFIYADTSGSGVLEFGTAWYFTPQAFFGTGTDGYGNPNNSNNGFLQLYDDNGSSIDSLDMGWDPTLQTFTLNASGTNADNTDYARAWPAPNPGGAAAISGGTFLQYALNLSASFAAPVTDGDAEGVNPDSVSGSFQALFQNTGSDPTYNGFYLISLIFGNGSSAAANDYGAIYAGDQHFSDVVANANFTAAVPLPAAWLFGASRLALFGAIGGLKRRRPAALA